VRATERGTRASAAELGARVAERLIEHGAGEILGETRHAQGAVEGIQP
jgi:hypothetical protein